MLHSSVQIAYLPTQYYASKMSHCVIVTVIKRKPSTCFLGAWVWGAHKSPCAKIHLSFKRLKNPPACDSSGWFSFGHKRKTLCEVNLALRIQASCHVLLIFVVSLHIVAFEIFDSYVLRFECLFYLILLYSMSLVSVAFHFLSYCFCRISICCFVLISDCFAVLDFDVSGFAVSNNGDKTDWMQGGDTETGQEKKWKGTD